MGVRGLATLARKRGGSTLETIDADTTLLIDGSGLCAHALRDQKCEYGGDLGALDAATTQFLERLLNRDFRVVVYLDGDQRRMKTQTAEDRLAKRRDEWSTLERYADGSNEPRRPAGDLPRPALASRVFEACLRRLDAPKRRKLTLLQCSEEADQRIAIDACRRKALIIGNDSDFLVFRDVRYVELEHASRIGEAQVRSRRPAVLRRLHAINATRVHLTMKWVVCFFILRPFGPNRDAPRRSPSGHEKAWQMLSTCRRRSSWNSASR
jgi:hypothetical protein